MQTCLIAGGAGFIGSHLCKKLLDQEFRVICVDNLITGSKNNIETYLENGNFKFIEHDITKPLEISEKIDFIFNLASPASPNKNSKKSYINFPIETLRANSEGTFQLLELARNKGSKFLFTSTSEVYGDPLVSPQKETYFGNVNPNGIRSVYDESKRFAESMIMAYFRIYGTDVKIVRIFNTYGPQMQPDDGRVVSNFIVSAINNKQIEIYGNGNNTRSFCYVSDLVEGIISMMFADNTKGEVINLGNPNEKSIHELAELIKAKTNSDSEIIFTDEPEDDPKQRKPDISKAKDLLNWEPVVSLEDGLVKTIEYFKSL
jgi:nucleoside-diphosphate-sugar epimerase